MLHLTLRSFMLRRKAPSRAAEAERRDSAGITCGNPGLLSKTEPRASRIAGDLPNAVYCRSLAMPSGRITYRAPYLKNSRFALPIEGVCAG